jgi:hypothetical protein
MQKKDQTFSKFCEFKELVEKESGKQVKALRSNNGGEYISNKFKDFCSREGIRRKLITVVGLMPASIVWSQTSTPCLVHQDRYYLTGLGFTKSEADANLYHIW